MTFHRCSSSLIVVDASVIDYEILANSICSNAHVLILDRDRDGVEQITQALATVESVESLHILSHGSSGALQLGAAYLSWQTLERYTAHLQAWAKALKPGAEILLYGCEVAAETIGQWFVQQLKSLTGAEVAASTNLTGSAALEGDWALEYATAPICTPIAFSPAAIASYPHVLTVLVTDTFRDAGVVDTSWRVGTGATVPGSPTPLLPFLTARNTDTAPTGGIPGNPTVQLDTPGEGALRLTSNLPDQSAFVLFDRPIGSRQGLTITFELYTYGGTTNPLRADGVSFFLLDGQVSPTEAGAFGGSLGYAQKNATPAAGLVPGLQGAYVGVGFDEYGNFSSSVDSPADINPIRTGGAADRIPDSIGVRAGEVTNYQYVTGTGSLPFGIDVPTATNREAAKRTVSIDLTTNGLLTVRIDSNNDGDFLDPGESSPELTNFDIANINGTAPPETLKFGFASGTGDFNNIHEIRNLFISTLNNPPSALDFAEVVPLSNSRRLTGFAGTDPDVADGDSIASYSILTLPDASQGILYRGNPASGGTAITTLPTGGLTLTPNEIQNIYFQATSELNRTTFTYTVTDTRGSSDETPATVTLTPRGITEPGAESKVCLPGETIRGNNRDNQIDGTPNIDTISGLGGNDRLRGLDCNDLLDGGRDNDNLIGGALRDRLRGRQDNDVARGNAGDDVIDSGLGRDKGYGGRGNDTGDGRRGNDLLEGRGGNDTLSGGRGRDQVFGNSNIDFLDGQQGNDLVEGGRGSDILNGGLGRDRLDGIRGNDVGRAGRGDDRLDGRGGNDNLSGGRGRDQVFGNSNNDFLDGQQNDDLVRGGKGSDTLNGGLGSDTLRATERRDAIFARRGNDIAWGGGGADRLFGQRGSDRLAGNPQADLLNGGSGNDVITGGTGDDRILTEEGADRIFYRSAEQGVDAIVDFDVAFDRIDLRQIFSRPEYTSTDSFDDYVRLSDSINGAILRVDSDGGVAGGFVRLAILQGVEVASLNSTTNFLS